MTRAERLRQAQTARAFFMFLARDWRCEHERLNLPRKTTAQLNAEDCDAAAALAKNFIQRESERERCSGRKFVKVDAND